MRRDGPAQTRSRRVGCQQLAHTSIFDTDWTTVEAWEKLAERCAQALHKGSRVRIVGSLHTRSWEDRENGQKRFKTVVRADEVLFLDARQEPAEAAETDEEPVEELPFSSGWRSLDHVMRPAPRGSERLALERVWFALTISPPPLHPTRPTPVRPATRAPLPTGRAPGRAPALRRPHPRAGERQ